MLDVALVELSVYEPRSLAHVFSFGVPGSIPSDEQDGSRYTYTGQIFYKIQLVTLIDK